MEAHKGKGGALDTMQWRVQLKHTRAKAVPTALGVEVAGVVFLRQQRRFPFELGLVQQRW